MRVSGLILALLLLSPTASPALAQGTPAPSAAATPAAPGLYRIGPDDTLEIMVFQVPELSRTVQVDATGQLTLPFVGRVAAAGLTADELSASLVEKLQGRYLKDPQVSVVVKQSVSQRVTVDGAVVKPGVYNILGPTSLLQAVALANGVDVRTANVRRVAIFRNVNGERRARFYDLGKIRDGKVADPQVQADDIVVVDTSGTRTFFSYFGGVPLIGALVRPF